MNNATQSLPRRFAAHALLLVATLFALSFATAQDADGDAVVIEAGEIVITRADFDERFRVAVFSAAAQQGQPVTDELMEQFAEVRPQFLDQLVTQMILIREADALGVSVSDEEIDAQVEQARAGLPEDQSFDEALEQVGFRDEGQFRELLREQALVNEAVSALQAGIEVDESDIEAFYEDNPDMFAQGEQVCARHILVETEAEAQEIVSELEAGADFEALAMERSVDPSGQQGGDLGCLERGATVPEFEDAAFATELDTTSDVVESQFGFHIIQPYDRVEEGTVSLDEAREQIVMQLQSERLEEEIAELRDTSDVEVYPENI